MVFDHNYQLVMPVKTLDVKILGSFDKKDFDLLMSRRINVQPKEELDKFKDAMYIYPTSDLVDQRNHFMLKQSGQPVFEIKATDTGSLKTPKDVIHNDHFTLSESLKLSVGSKVFLTTNSFFEKRLHAGKRGVVTEVVYRRNDKEYDIAQKELPESILVEFEDFKGISNLLVLCLNDLKILV